MANRFRENEPKVKHSITSVSLPVTEEPLPGQVTVDEYLGEKPVEAAVPAEKTEEDAKAAKKAGRPKLQRETKKRVTFTLLPSLYDEAAKIAYEKGTNMSELISELLEKYVKKHR